MKIGPYDPLEIGTKVSVGSKLGTVIACDYVPARPSGMIYVHTIRFTDKRVPYRGRDGQMHYKLEPVKAINQRINYASINVI